MTDLEKRANEYAIKVAEKNVMPKDCFAEHLIRQAYLDATKAETALLSQHILDLQKDKGNLTDRVRELEQQIDKMKCCGNCENGELSAHEEPCLHCQRCFASKDVTDQENVKDNWEAIKEIKENE